MKSNGFPYLTDTLKEGCETWPECGCPIDRCDADDVMARPLMVVVLTMAAWVVLLLALIAFAMGAVGMVKAYAHNATPTASQPLGWAYDYSCCSLADCREVKTSAVKVDGKGYTIVATGELLAYGDKRIRRSKDEFYHWCSVAGLEDSKSLCLYVPDGTF